MKHASAGVASARPTPPALADHAGSEDLDLAGVDPIRFDEVRRRVGVLKAYLNETHPDVGSRRRHARSLGLSVNQFLALVRAWREHGRAVAISGAGAARGSPRADVPRSLPRASKDAAREIIATLGHDVPHVVAVRAVQARCAALGVKAPSPSTVWNMVMTARRDAVQAPEGNEVILSRCNLKLPVEIDGVIAFPQIALMIDASSGEILAASMDDRDDPLTSMLAELRPRLHGREIVMDGGIAIDADGFAGMQLRPVRPSVARTATARTLGRGFGSVDLIYQLSRAIDPARALRARKDRPLSDADARRHVFQQMAVHNAARGAPPPVVDRSP